MTKDLLRQVFCQAEIRTCSPSPAGRSPQRGTGTARPKDEKVGVGVSDFVDKSRIRFSIKNREIHPVEKTGIEQTHPNPFIYTNPATPYV